MCTILKLAVLAVLALLVAWSSSSSTRRVDVSISPTPTPTVQARFRDRPRRVRQARIDQELERWDEVVRPPRHSEVLPHTPPQLPIHRRIALMEIEIPDANPIDCPECTKGGGGH